MGPRVQVTCNAAVLIDEKGKELGKQEAALEKVISLCFNMTVSKTYTSIIMFTSSTP